MLTLYLFPEIQIAGKLNTIIREMGLRELGQLEQDLVFGDAGAKEVINFLRKNQVILYCIQAFSLAFMLLVCL